MKKILHVSQKIKHVECENDFGWLQLRLLVLELLNTAFLLTLNKGRKKEMKHIHNLQGLYKDYLQVPYHNIQDKVFCLSIKNEVLSEVDTIIEQYA
ncbi:MAG: hypothetical protein JWN76_3397 [Chitinophagaceae bacterium]|nr:hypothetical protein [Chitinophagaceae bacterium]